MKKYSKLFAILLAVAMILPGVAGVAEAATFEDNSANVIRLAGSGRVETSIEASKAGFPTAGSATNVVLAGYDGEVDALTGTLLANAKNAPLLLTNKNAAPNVLLDELTRLGAKNVFVLGGKTVVDEAVVTQLKGLGYTVKRVAGADRDLTAQAVAKEAGTQTKHVFLTKGYDNQLADALSVGPASAKNARPVLLTKTNEVPANTKAAMADLGVTHVTIVGGPVAVSTDLENALRAEGKTVDRVAGTTREGTAVAVANTYFPNAKNALVANGYVFYDALVAGYLGAKVSAPIILTATNKMDPVSKAFLTANTDKAWILGGNSSVSTVVGKEIVTAVEGEDLKVTSVSAINANYVTVAITAPEEDLLAQEVEVKNGAGVVVPVKPLDIAAGDKTAEFEFVTAVKAADLKGVWTVNGQSYDLDLFNNLSAFLNAGDQLALNKALTDLGIKNVDIANIPAYETAKGAVTKTAYELTVADVQKLVDDVNAKAVSAEDEAAIVKAVTDAQKVGNEVALLAALQNKAFVRVNPDWVTEATDGYLKKIAGTETTIAQVQTVINTSNDTIIKKAPTTTGIDRVKLNETLALVNEYATVDKDGKITDGTIKTYPELIEIQLAVADVVAATTPTALKNKLTVLAGLDKTNLDMKNYVDANGKAYITALGALADTAKDTTTQIAGVITATNTAEAGKLVAAVKIAASASPVDADALLKALNDLGLKQVAASNKDVYKADAAAFVTESAAGKTKADVQKQVDKSNVKAVTSETDADKLLVALKVLELKNIVDANKDAYLADVTGGAATIKTDATTIDAALAAINTAELEKAKVKAINEATTAEEVKVALDELAITSYVNVPKADKLYVAEQVLELRDTLTAGRDALKADGTASGNTTTDAKKFVDVAEITGNLDVATTGIIAKYDKLIADLNASALTDISTAVTNLTAIEYDAFDSLSAGDKAAVAELFIANYPKDSTGSAVDFTTLAAVKVAIDTAIAAQ